MNNRQAEELKQEEESDKKEKGDEEKRMHIWRINLCNLHLERSA